MMSNTTRFFRLATRDIRFNFSEARYAERASHHIFLQSTGRGDPIGVIDYVEDESLTGLIRTECKPNVVHIDREALDDGSCRLTLGMFGKYTIVLQISPDRVLVRYPSDAPPSLMMDDVLQAAIGPLLAKVGGFILHGSCVVRDGIAVAIMGASGAGKSTTAFNLMRFGFQCYADDAVIVVPDNDGLLALPLSRELSIRPLTFRLFQEQGVNIEGYQKDGEKYYFTQDCENVSGARLNHLCFVEVCGERDTTISFLERAQTLDVLLENKRHFSFLDRPSAALHANVLAEKVPAPFAASVGTDLNRQGAVFTAVVEGRDLGVREAVEPSATEKGRQWKKALLRRAWADPDQAPIEEIVPMLGACDPQVLKLAFGFMQTYPLARLEPIGPCAADIRTPWQSEAPWLRASEWSRGCKTAARVLPPEVFEGFTFPWLKSAPILCPFLKTSCVGDPRKGVHVDAARARYAQEVAATDVDRTTTIRISAIASESESTAILRDAFSTDETAHACVRCLIDEGEGASLGHLDGLFDALRQASSIVVVPVFLDRTPSMALSMEFVRQALRSGLDVKVSRHVPLCALDASEAQFLLNEGALELAADRAVLTAQSGGSAHETDVPGLVRIETPYRACESCALSPLGLCGGGVFTTEGTN
jgi:hypothetical protein